MPLKKVVIELQLLSKIMDIPCPVKDNHQHGSCRLAKEGSAYDLTLTIGILHLNKLKLLILINIIMELSLDDGSTAYTRSVTYRHKS
jgi:hypothetical protein